MVCHGPDPGHVAMYPVPPTVAQKPTDGHDTAAGTKPGKMDPALHGTRFAGWRLRSARPALSTPTQRWAEGHERPVNMLEAGSRSPSAPDGVQPAGAAAGRVVEK